MPQQATQDDTDWTTISQQLNRDPGEVHTKWDALQASHIKRDPFTAEEDAVILRTVGELGGCWKGQRAVGESAARDAQKRD